MKRKTVGFWLPFRKEMTSVSYEHPGALVEPVRNWFLAKLTEQELDLIEVPDFRNALLESGRPLLGDRDLSGLDAFIWFGDIGRDYRREYNLAVLEAIAEHAEVINRPSGYALAMDKFLTSRMLARHGISVPKFMLVTPDNSEEAGTRAKEWGGPVLLKPRLGSYGVGIVKLDAPQALVDCLDYAPPAAHFVEQFIPNDPKSWIGINIIGGEHAYSYRKGSDSFQDGWKVFDRSRTGGKMLLAKPSDEQIAIAKEVARLFRMDWVGVDLVTDAQGKSFVIDVNAFPGLYPEMFAQAHVDGPGMMAKAVGKRLEGKE